MESKECLKDIIGENIQGLYYSSLGLSVFIAKVIELVITTLVA
jgi:hypothetical protein